MQSGKCVWRGSIGYICLSSRGKIRYSLVPICICTKNFLFCHSYSRKARLTTRWIPLRWMKFAFSQRDLASNCVPRHSCFDFFTPSKKFPGLFTNETTYVNTHPTRVQHSHLYIISVLTSPFSCLYVLRNLLYFRQLLLLHVSVIREWMSKQKKLSIHCSNTKAVHAWWNFKRAKTSLN